MKIGFEDALSVGLLLVGVAVVVVAFLQFPTAGATAYHTQLSTGDGADLQNGPVHQFTRLSPAAQRAFLDARAASDGRSTVYERAAVATEFDYGPDPTTAHVFYKDEVYTVRTHREGAYATLEGLVFLLAVALGILLITGGGWGLYRERR